MFENLANSAAIVGIERKARSKIFFHRIATRWTVKRATKNNAVQGVFIIH